MIVLLVAPCVMHPLHLPRQSSFHIVLLTPPTHALLHNSFVFDGTRINPNSTAEDLGLDDGKLTMGGFRFALRSQQPWDVREADSLHGLPVLQQQLLLHVQCHALWSACPTAALPV